jgi:hypothetical protein
MSDHAQHQWDQTTFNGPTEHEWTPDELTTEYGPEIAEWLLRIKTASNKWHRNPVFKQLAESANNLDSLLGIKTHGIGSGYAVNHLDDSLMLMSKRAYQLADEFPESRHYDCMDYAGELYAFGSLCLDMVQEICK